MASKSYSDLLKDPRWQRRRLEILNRSNFTCESCESGDKTLHVHHKIYRKGSMPWEYTDTELESLCEDCHEAEHVIRDALAETLARLPLHKLEMVLGYAEAQFAMGLDFRELSKSPVAVKSYERAAGMLDALWQWNGGGDKPGADCLCDHRALDDRLVCSLGEGEMPLPKSNN